jgi:hypothetical protein
MPCLLFIDGKSSGHFNSLNNQKDCTRAKELGQGLVSGSQLQIIREYGFIPHNLFRINNNNLLSDVLTRLFSSWNPGRR